MRNPPDFVVYVVMFRTPGEKNYMPRPYSSSYGEYFHAIGYFKRKDALEVCRGVQAIYGKKSAYVQQYGPYS